MRDEISVATGQTAYYNFPMAYDDDLKLPVKIYQESVLRQFVCRFMMAMGAPRAEADIVTDGLITAALCWHPGQGQGLEKLFRYLRRVRNGGIIPGAAMEWIKDSPSHALLDANKGFGYVAAHRAMQSAIEKAKSGAIAMVGVCHSNHFGIAGYHALQAAEVGLIGWAVTNAGAEMAPTGSAKPVLGTNPWAFAVPRKNNPPIVLDMALTMSGKGMMRWFDRSGRSMPANWALTLDGQETNEPAKAVNGPLLPIGEYKGYGLSLVSDILTGVMTGSLFGLSVFQEDTNFDVGHILCAINPEAFLSRDEFDDRLEKLVEEVKQAPPIDPEHPVLLPGEPEFKRMEQRRVEGIPIDRNTVIKLHELSKELQVNCPL
jgi:LDH2 family malate/lactate/ureidoglycolate dehydrogenase